MEEESTRALFNVIGLFLNGVELLKGGSGLSGGVSVKKESMFNVRGLFLEGRSGLLGGFSTEEESMFNVTGLFLNGVELLKGGSGLSGGFSLEEKSMFRGLFLEGGSGL